MADDTEGWSTSLLYYNIGALSGIPTILPPPVFPAKDLRTSLLLASPHKVERRALSWGEEN